MYLQCWICVAAVMVCCVDVAASATWRLDDRGMLKREVQQPALLDSASFILPTRANDPAIDWQVNYPTGYPFDQAAQGDGGVIVGAQNCNFTFGEWRVNGSYIWKSFDPAGHTGCIDGSLEDITTYYTTQAAHAQPQLPVVVVASFHSVGQYPGTAWSTRIARLHASGAEMWSVDIDALSNINVKKPLLLSDDGRMFALLAANCSAGFDERSTSLVFMDPENGRTLWSRQISDIPYRAHMSAKGSDSGSTAAELVAVVASRSVSFFDAATGQTVAQQLQLPSFTHGTALSSDSKYFAACHNSSITLYQFSSSHSAYVPSATLPLSASYPAPAGTTWVSNGLLFATTGSLTLLIAGSAASPDYQIVTLDAWSLPLPAIPEPKSSPISQQPKPLWSFACDTPSQQQLQEAFSAFSLVQADSVLVVGSWGAGYGLFGNDRPTVRVICTASGHVAASFVSDGSVFDVSAREDVLGLTVAVAAKHTHANTIVPGGDFYFLHYNASTTAVCV